MNNQVQKYLKSQSFFETPLVYFGISRELNIDNPENLTKKEVLEIELKLQKEPDNLYFLETYIIYYYNKGNLNLEKYFNRYLKLYPDNPYILLRFARYQSSSLYKKFNKNKKYLELALTNSIKAISILENKYKENEIPTFVYSWLGFIYLELGKYIKAIEIFDKTIYFNKKFHNHKESEPFLWKAIAFNKLGKYKESNKIYYENIELVDKGLINNKLDFRVYKIISDNYYNLGNNELFYKNLKTTIEKFLEIFSFHFNDGNYILDKNNYKLKFNNILDINSYNSFLEYNKKYLGNYLDYIILSISYLYKNKLLGKNIIFNDSRGIEILCLNYLKLIYEGKI